jgi:hypothetical protein
MNEEYFRVLGSRGYPAKKLTYAELERELLAMKQTHEHMKRQVAQLQNAVSRYQQTLQHLYNESIKVLNEYPPVDGKRPCSLCGRWNCQDSHDGN